MQASVSRSSTNKTAHTSLQCVPNVKQRTTVFRPSQRQKQTRCALNYKRAPPEMPQNSLARTSRTPVRSALAAPSCASAPPVRGYLRIGVSTRKCFFSESTIFSTLPLGNRPGWPLLAGKWPFSAMLSTWPPAFCRSQGQKSGRAKGIARASIVSIPLKGQPRAQIPC